MDENSYAHETIVNKSACIVNPMSPISIFVECALCFLKSNVSSLASQADISVKGKHSELYSALPRRLGLDNSKIKIYDKGGKDDYRFCGTPLFSSICSVNGFVNFSVSDEVYALLCQEISLALPKGAPLDVIEISETSVGYAHARLLDAAERGAIEDVSFSNEEKSALWACLLLLEGKKYSSSLAESVRAVNLVLKPVNCVAPRIRRDAATAMAGILYSKIIK